MPKFELIVHDGDVISSQLNSEKVLDNSDFTIEEERHINEKSSGRHWAAQFFSLLNAERIDHLNNGLCAFCDHSAEEKNGPFPKDDL